MRKLLKQNELRTKIVFDALLGYTADATSAMKICRYTLHTEENLRDDLFIMKNAPSLIDIVRDFPDEKHCVDYMETMRWPEGVRCLTCGCDSISKFTSSSKKQTVRYLYQCLEPTCKQQFTVTSGTILHDSHLPLRTWFLAVALVCNAKKGLSAMQMQRDLGIKSYRTAWYLNHRIRKAMEEGVSLFSGVVEADETYVGG